jgi:hypothetical protein
VKTSKDYNLKTSKDSNSRLNKNPSTSRKREVQNGNQKITYADKKNNLKNSHGQWGSDVESAESEGEWVEMKR